MSSIIYLGSGKHGQIVVNPDGTAEHHLTTSTAHAAGAWGTDPDVIYAYHHYADADETGKWLASRVYGHHNQDAHERGF